MRYLDPTNSDRFVDRDVERYWMGPRTDVRPDHPGGVDLYVGGVEHAVLHLLCASGTRCCTTSARSSHRAVRPSVQPGLHPGCRSRMLARSTSTPPRSRATTATASRSRASPSHAEWGKMGKSLKNAVSPDEMYEQYGADTLRLYEMAGGPLDASRPWETRDVVGMYRSAGACGARWSTRRAVGAPSSIRRRTTPHGCCCTRPSTPCAPRWKHSFKPRSPNWWS